MLIRWKPAVSTGKYGKCLMLLPLLLAIRTPSRILMTSGCSSDDGRSVFLHLLNDCIRSPDKSLHQRLSVFSASQFVRRLLLVVADHKWNQATEQPADSIKLVILIIVVFVVTAAMAELWTIKCKADDGFAWASRNPLHYHASALKKWNAPSRCWNNDGVRISL